MDAWNSFEANIIKSNIICIAWPFYGYSCISSFEMQTLIMCKLNTNFLMNGNVVSWQNYFEVDWQRHLDSFQLISSRCLNS